MVHICKSNSVTCVCLSGVCVSSCVYIRPLRHYSEEDTISSKIGSFSYKYDTKSKSEFQARYNGSCEGSAIVIEAPGDQQLWILNPPKFDVLVLLIPSC